MHTHIKVSGNLSVYSAAKSVSICTSLAGINVCDVIIASSVKVGIDLVLLTQVTVVNHICLLFVKSVNPYSKWIK